MTVVGVPPEVVGAVVDDGVLWIAYPKKPSSRYTSDLSRDDSWQPLGEAGMEPVRQVAVDADWSALRFRRAEHIGQLKRDPARLLAQHARRRVAPRSKAPADPPEVAEFLAALPEDRRAILTRVHEVIRTAAPSWSRRSRATCWDTARSTPATPPGGRATPDGAYLAEANADGLGKVSVGRSCVRFTKLDDLDLDVLAELMRTAVRNPASTG